MPVVVPTGVDVTINGREVRVQGPKGSLHVEIAAPIEVSHSTGAITVTRPSDEGERPGLERSHFLIAQMGRRASKGLKQSAGRGEQEEMSKAR